MTKKEIDYQALMAHAKAFSGYTPEREALLAESGSAIIPHLQKVTDIFYDTLTNIPATSPYLDGRMDTLKQTHLKWLEDIIKGPCDVEYTRQMYKVGDVHVKVKLPVEFMAGGMCLILGTLVPILKDICGGDVERLNNLLQAFNSALGFSLMVMQESYQSSSLAEELERFLAITGMSRVLFDNLANAYQA